MASPQPSAALGPPPGRPRVALAIGKFDGVHAGHRHLAARLVAAADETGLRSVAVVLHPDPASVLAGVAVPLLTTVAERARRLRAFGVDNVWHLPFDPALAALSPAAFWELLSASLDIRQVVIGPDFAFGRGRAGNAATLAEFAAVRGFALTVVPPLADGGAKLGSRALRERIQAGDVAAAATGLRAAPQVTGRVVRGAQRGRTLGFPTANLALAEDFAVPANGVYIVRAAWTWADGRAVAASADGLASVGVRPTFDNGERIVEVYLLDFDGDLYGADMTVEFVARQRGEERFDSAAALVEQMHRDEAEARAWLGEQALPAHAWADRRTLVARGRDLAELCEQLLAGTRPGLDVGPGVGDRVRRPLDLNPGGNGPDQVLAAWLAYIGDAAQGGLVGAQVYHATEDGVRALVTHDRPAGTPNRGLHLAGLATLPHGRLVATAQVPDEPERPGPDQR